MKRFSKIKVQSVLPCTKNTAVKYSSCKPNGRISLGLAKVMLRVLRRRCRFLSLKSNLLFPLFGNSQHWEGSGKRTGTEKV